MKYTVKLENEDFYLYVDGNKMHKFRKEDDTSLINVWLDNQKYKPTDIPVDEMKTFIGTLSENSKGFTIDPNIVEIMTISTGEIIEGNEKRTTYYKIK